MLANVKLGKIPSLDLTQSLNNETQILTGCLALPQLTELHKLLLVMRVYLFL